MIVDRTCFSYSVASIIWRVVMAAGSSRDGVISSVEYRLAYNWVVNVLFIVDDNKT